MLTWQIMNLAVVIQTVLWYIVQEWSFEDRLNGPARIDLKCLWTLWRALQKLIEIYCNEKASETMTLTAFNNNYNYYYAHRRKLLLGLCRDWATPPLFQTSVRQRVCPFYSTSTNTSLYVSIDGTQNPSAKYQMQRCATSAWPNGATKMVTITTIL